MSGRQYRSAPQNMLSPPDLGSLDVCKAQGRVNRAHPSWYPALGLIQLRQSHPSWYKALILKMQLPGSFSFAESEPPAQTCRAAALRKALLR